MSKKGFTLTVNNSSNSGKTWDSEVWFSISYDVKKRKVHHLCTAIKERLAMSLHFEIIFKP